MSAEELHVLRNPYGHSDEAKRAARQWAGDEIERLTRELSETREMEATTARLLEHARGKLVAQDRALSEARAEVEQLQRGEFICTQCGNKEPQP